LWIDRINIMKMTILSKVMYKFLWNLHQHSNDNLCRYRKYPYNYMETQNSWIGEANLSKKINAGITTISNYTTESY
jgi:hypothetical protein